MFKYACQAYIMSRKKGYIQGKCGASGITEFESRKLSQEARDGR